MQGVNSMLDLIDGKIDGSEAVVETAKSAGKATVKGYAYGVTGSLINGGLTVAASKVESETAKHILSSLADSSIRTILLVGTVEFTKSIVGYLQNEITKEQMMIQLGETSVGLAGSMLGGAIGRVAGPPGQMVGATIGYIVSSCLLKGVIEARQTRRLAYYYNEMSLLYEAAKTQMVQARENFEKVCFQMRLNRISQVRDALTNMDIAVQNSSIEEFVQSLDKVCMIYGDGIKYKTKESFASDMMNPLVSIEI